MSLRVRPLHFGSKIELPDAEAVLDEFEKSLTGNYASQRSDWQIWQRARPK
jgi:hypothetical protein